jgi:hypothetical protein
VIELVRNLLSYPEQKKGKDMLEKGKLGFAGVLAVASFALAASAWAGNVLIVNGSSTTSETDTTADITAHLTMLETAAGNTVTVDDQPPATLAGIDEVWDIRFSNSSPLTASDQSLYLAFLQGGHRMFVMGENAGFPTRNASVIAFIASAGGGSLTFVVPTQTQAVIPPFTLPNPVSTITYRASGGTTTPGTGVFATSAGGQGSAISYSPGQLSGAPGATLVAVFDVNFMQAGESADEVAFFKNLIGFINNGGQPAGPPAQVPTLSTWALIAMSLGLVLVAVRTGTRRRS